MRTIATPAVLLILALSGACAARPGAPEGHAHQASGTGVTPPASDNGAPGPRVPENHPALGAPGAPRPAACSTDNYEPDDTIAQAEAQTLEQAEGGGSPEGFFGLQGHVACPNEIDYSRGISKNTLFVVLYWSPKQGGLDASLVNADGSPYQFKGPREGMLRKPGEIRFSGGGRDSYVRVENKGAAPISYSLGLAYGGYLYENW